MTSTTPKKIHNPIPPEYANVSILRFITIGVACLSLIMVSYATWIVYTMSNRLAHYETIFQVESMSARVAPINFKLLEQILSIDQAKQNFTFVPYSRNPFYDRAITSTQSNLFDLRTTSTPSSSAETSSSTSL